MANRQARYQVGDMIGGQFKVYQVHMGGMGEVYLCLDENKIPIALKTFQGADIRMKKLFEDETRTWIELGIHPNIVHCHWMNLHNSIPFMGLEWILGEEGYGADLRSWVRQGALSLKQSLKFAIDICRGLAYAGEKSKGIVHRDLKPDNVLVARGRTAKVTDFGLATIIQKSEMAISTGEVMDDESRHQSIRQGNMVGTPAYMPPEQWLGDVDIDARADMYAVGCILYEMLTGRMPYVANTISQLRLQHLESPIPHVKDVHIEINAIISKCMAKNRDDRYSTVQALLDVLMRTYQTHTGESLPDVQAGKMTAEDYGNRGLTYANLGEDDRAIADYDTAIHLNPNLALIFTNRGLSYANKGMDDRAIEDYDTAIHLNPNLALAYMNRGNSYQSKKMIDRATEDYDTAIRLNPNYANAYYNRGVSYENKGMIDRAIEDYDAAIRLNPNYATAYTNRGVSYGKKGMIDHTFTDFDTAIRLNPSDANAYMNRGNSYANKGIHDRAISDFNEAIRLNPNLALAYMNRGNSHQNKGMIDRAIADFDQAIRLNPNNANAYYNRGVSHQNKRMNDRAIADFDEAIRLNPNDAQAWFNKGAVHTNTGRLQEALTCFEKAYQLGLTQAIGAIQQVKQSMGMRIPPPQQNNTQIAFEAFQHPASLDEMRQAMAQHPILKEMIQYIQQTIQNHVPPHLKSHFETRLAWLIQIAKGD